MPIPTLSGRSLLERRPELMYELSAIASCELSFLWSNPREWTVYGDMSEVELTPDQVSHLLSYLRSELSDGGLLSRAHLSSRLTCDLPTLEWQAERRSIGRMHSQAQGLVRELSKVQASAQVAR